MHRKLTLATLLLLGSCFLAQAQETFLLGPGDKLHIQVFDTPEMEQHPQVTDAGTIPLVMLGDVKVGGLSPAQAAEEIQKALIQKQIMLHPHVTVTVDDNESGEVYVMGQVKDPGSYEIRTAMPVLKVLALASGLTDMADRHITIERHTATGTPGERTNYFFSNSSTEALDANVLVYPGDTVVVPKVGIVYVLGDVGKPGGYPMPGNSSDITVLQALSWAGSTNKSALVSKVKLLRKTPSGMTEVPIKLSAMEKGQNPDIPMQPDDVLYVPSSLLKNVAVNGSSIVAAVGSSAIYARP